MYYFVFVTGPRFYDLSDVGLSLFGWSYVMFLYYHLVLFLFAAYYFIVLLQTLKEGRSALDGWGRQFNLFVFVLFAFWYLIGFVRMSLQI